MNAADYFSGTTSSTGLTVSTLPCDSRPVYVALAAQVNGVYQTTTQYEYNATSGCAALLAPSDGTTLVGTTVTFSWATVVGADQYQLKVGSAPGQADIFASITGVTSLTVNSIPCIPIFVQFSTHLNGVFQNPGLYQYGPPSGCSRPASSSPDFNGDGKGRYFPLRSDRRQWLRGIERRPGTFSYINTPFNPGFDIIRPGKLNNDFYTDLIAYNSTNAIGYALLGTGTGSVQRECPCSGDLDSRLSRLAT